MARSELAWIIPPTTYASEIGAFIAARGKRRTLVVVEEGVQVPADLAGDLYLPVSAEADEADRTEFLEAADRVYRRVGVGSGAVRRLKSPLHRVAADRRASRRSTR